MAVEVEITEPSAVAPAAELGTQAARLQYAATAAQDFPKLDSFADYFRVYKNIRGCRRSLQASRLRSQLGGRTLPRSVL